MTELADPMAMAQARASLLLDGALRVGLNLSNFLLVRRVDATGQPEGVAPALAARLAVALQARLEFVCYDTPSQVIDDAASNAWSIAFVAADPRRAADTVFSAPYAGIEATYLVPADSGYASAGEVDAPGVRIASFKGSAYDLWLQQNLRNAQLVHADTPKDALESFLRDRLEALAGLRVQLDSEAARDPGCRVLDGCFTAVRQAIAVPKGRAAALGYVDAFLRQEKQSGGLAALIACLAPSGLQIDNETKRSTPT
ncbi:transporter substrate-binding domain-containing protein [Variovorax paradoxus]|nr:transporter substrate-binding domain-containing protein [Variovorax paradoxus]